MCEITTKTAKLLCLVRKVYPASVELVIDNLMIAYISRGSLDDLEEQNATMLQVTAQQALLRNRVIINTYMPVEEKSATVLFEKTFMSHLATR
ncbi:unnamed protein product [Mesocestoides corti]|uniref:Transcriptional regulator n=1 Tax=Mesocestoides corti TaxID=53468 RepID=A0A0R3UCV0_MESCO|nr:unnamed protein product [Mesocestoides corti]